MGGFAALLAAAAVFAAATAASQELLPTAVPVRVAIVIGNQDYALVDDLPNAARDAADMTTMLRQHGFEVHEGINLDRRGFERLIRDALLNLPQGSEVVFFYAGHGIQIGARNYLLPTDAAFADVNDLPVYAITLDRVVEALAARGSVHVVFIDSCRENPFPGLRLSADLSAALVETRQGFSPYPAPLNSLVAYSTSPGQTAADGPPGANSPYTGALLQAVAGAPDEIFRRCSPASANASMPKPAAPRCPGKARRLSAPSTLPCRATDPLSPPPCCRWPKRPSAAPRRKPPR